MALLSNGFFRGRHTYNLIIQLCSKIDLYIVQMYLIVCCHCHLQHEYKTFAIHNDLLVSYFCEYMRDSFFRVLVSDRE